VRRADAITWAPDYPGIGRIPRVVSGVVAPHREVDSTDLDALMHNVLADERGKRTFVLGGDDAHAIATPPVERSTGDAFALRGLTTRRDVAVAAAELSTAVLGSVLGVRARVAVRALSSEEGGGIAFDLVVARERPRGMHAPHAVHAVVLDDEGMLARHNPLVRLAPGGWIAVPTRQRSADALWAEVPAWAKAVAFDARARVLGWAPSPADQSPWAGAAAFVGVALAVAAGHPVLGTTRPVDESLVEREVTDALRVALQAEGTARQGIAEEIVRAGAMLARSAFGAHIEVPRATIEREDETVRLGRRDARAVRLSESPARMR
jgi:hypothetical protein